jgi:TRAP-type C4-dicarboxylate transport system substrate-binding protein
MLYPHDRDVYYCHYELGLNELKRPEFEKFNTYFVGPMPVSGSGCGFMTVDPIRTLDDFKGVKVRSFGAYLDWCEALGMEAVYLPHDEVYMALQLGTINAYLTVRGVQYVWKGHEVCDYYYFPSTGSGTNSILVNLDAWKSLTPELQGQIQQAAEMHAGWMLYSYVPVYCEQATNWFDNYGLERIDWGPEVVDAMYKEAETCWEDFAEADPPVSRQLIDIVTGYLAKKRAGELP